MNSFRMKNHFFPYEHCIYCNMPMLVKIISLKTIVCYIINEEAFIYCVIHNVNILTTYIGYCKINFLISLTKIIVFKT